MYINQICHYLPAKVLDNAYFSKTTGLSEDELLKKAGIRTRVVCAKGENSSTIAIKAIETCKDKYVFQLQDIDLIVSATYTPHDTINTIAHVVQNHYKIPNAKALQVSSACSSFINAMEVVRGYQEINKTNKSLVIASEHNTGFVDETDVKAGHLWGDAAAAVFVSKEKIGTKSLRVIDIISTGLGHIGMSIEAITLKPMDDGLRMYHGKDVFIHAIEYMTKFVQDIVTKNGYALSDLKYLVPHQANIRIIDQVAKNLNCDKSKILINIQKYGNTGCVSTPLLLSEHWNEFEQADLIAVTVFGGGYSAGAMLLEVV